MPDQSPPNKPDAPIVPEDKPVEVMHDDPLTGHSYDGIMEYDNPTPGWWNMLFIASILFAPLYFLVTLAAEGDLGPQGEYERAQIADLERKFGEIGELTPDAATIMQYSLDDQWMAYAEKRFTSACASCHAIDGSGQTGPNLTDDFYIHVQSVEDIHDVIANGRANNAMPAQSNSMHPNDVILLSSYVAQLRGRNLPGEGQEGELAPPWEEPAE